jgi:ribosomal subunit interface protein
VNIIFKGRRTEVQDQFRKHASAKLGKLEKLDHKAMRIDVEVCRERNPRQSGRRERIELTVRSRGPVIRAEAAADDRYAALDRALAKLEERLRRSNSRRKTARAAQAASRASSLRALAAVAGGAAVELPGSASPGDAQARSNGDVASLNGQRHDADTGAEDEEPTSEAARVVPIPMDGDGPLVVREKFHTALPMSVDQALLEMELVGHDFYLFRDQANGLPCVVYRRRGYDYGLIRLVEQAPAGAVGDRGRM